MKKNPKKGKELKLDKKLITNLNQIEMEAIKGGKIAEQSTISITATWSITYTWTYTWDSGTN
ncbi:class I lanthipeptide [Flavobacterium sp. Arc3]|uniref:class I lanthipeptide n=1 Tax=Flavobacterium sp. Arc3 TaxID=3046686 RepID=UPI00352BD727